jgi:hypothetical protein
MATPVDPDGIVLPFSCSTNFANDLDDSLPLMRLGSRMLEFCSFLRRRTLGNAGWHRKNKHRETWCFFDLASWAEAFHENRSNLKRIISDLEAGNIIWFLPDPEHPGSGRIGWNVQVAEWTPRPKRSTRIPATRGQPSLGIQQQANVVILPTAPNAPSKQAGLVIQQRQESGVLSYSPPDSALAPCKITKHDCSEEVASGGAETGLTQIASARVKKEYGEKKIRKEPVTLVTGASLMASPSTQVASHSVEVTEVILPPSQGVLFLANESNGAAIKKPAPTADPVKQNGGKVRGKKPALSPVEAERLAQEQAAFAARLAELTTIWLAHPRTVKPEQMGDSERRSFYSGMNKLAYSSLTPAELPKLLTTMAGWSKGTFIPDPYVLEGKLGKLRLEAKQGGTANGTTEPVAAQPSVDPARSYSRFALQLPRRNPANA